MTSASTTFPPEAEEFRREVATLLDECLTPDVLARVEATGTVHDWALHRGLAERGWVAPGWPAEYGGAPALSVFEVAVLWEELGLRGAPMDGLSTTTMIAKTLLATATAELCEEVLPRAARGESIFCLGYTEPDNGSDVAAASTVARRSGEGWVISGQKMFTTLAEESEFVFLLTRSDPEAPKHRGLTMFLVPLAAEGVEIHPVRTLGGERTNVTFYSDVHVNDLYRVGEVNRGWDVMITALTHERTGVGRYGKNVRLLEAALAYHAASETLSGEDRAALQASIARLALENEVSRLLARETVWAEADGRLAGVEGSMSKLWTSESLVRASSELARLVPDALFDHHQGPIEVLSKMLRHAPVTTIYGGTSEIQRGIIASRRLNIAKVD